MKLSMGRSLTIFLLGTLPLVACTVYDVSLLSSSSQTPMGGSAGMMSNTGGDPPTGGGSGGRAAAGAIRLGHAIGAVFTDRRVLEPVEARIALLSGALLLALAVLFAAFPRALVYPLVVVFVWIGIVLVYKGYRLHRDGRRRMEATRADGASHRPQ